MTSDATTVIDALRRSHDHLAGFAAGLTAEQLRTSSTCSDWDVSQVLSHLGSGGEINRLAFTAQQRDEDPPAPQAIWDRWDGWSPEERRDGFLAEDEANLATWEAIPEEARETTTVDVPFLPDPISLATAVGMRLSEHALHSWDVFATFDPAARVDPPSANALAARVSPIFGYLARGTWHGEGGDIAISLTDPSAELTLSVGESTSLAAGQPSHPIGRLALSGDAWLRLAYGRLAPERTPAGVTSDPADLLDRLRTLFPGI